MDMVLATRLLEGFSEVQRVTPTKAQIAWVAKKPTQRSLNVKTTDIGKFNHDRYDFLRVVSLMAKAEVYEKVDRDRKTRNIAIYNSFGMLPAHVMIYNWSRLLVNGLNNPYIMGKRQNLGSTPSLLGFSVFGGGMNTYLNHMADLEPGQQLVWVYADNLMISYWEHGRLWHASLDGNKMEASVTEDDVYHICYEICKLYVAEGGITTEWNSYMLTLLPKLVTKPLGLFGQHELIMNHMGSGAVGTAYFNTIVMMRLLLMCEKEECTIMHDGEMSTKFLKLAKKAGISLKIEALDEVPLYKTDSGYMVSTERGIKLALLGYDAHPMVIDEDLTVQMPILGYERRLGSALFRKEHKTKESEFADIVTAYLELVRYKTLYFLGAWSNLVEGDIVWHYAARAWVRLKNMMSSVVDGTKEQGEAVLRALREAAASYNESGEHDWSVDVELMLNVSEIAELPTIFELVKIMTGSVEVARRAVVYRQGTLPDHLLVPTSMFEEYGFEDRGDIDYLIEVNEELPGYVMPALSKQAVKVRNINMKTKMSSFDQPQVKSKEVRGRKTGPETPFFKTTVPSAKVLTDTEFNMLQRSMRFNTPHYFVVPLSQGEYDTYVSSGMKSEAAVARTAYLRFLAQKFKVSIKTAKEALDLMEQSKPNVVKWRVMPLTSLDLVVSPGDARASMKGDWTKYSYAASLLDYIPLAPQEIITRVRQLPKELDNRFPNGWISYVRDLNKSILGDFD